MGNQTSPLNFFAARGWRRGIFLPSPPGGKKYHRRPLTKKILLARVF
jgi:hypothetical protein